MPYSHHELHLLETFIRKTVASFYAVVMTDILLSYQFRHLIPTLKNHEEHVSSIWMQFLFKKDLKNPEVMNLFFKHLFKKHKENLLAPLKKGELFRWKLLFKKSLDETFVTIVQTSSLSVHDVTLLENFLLEWFSIIEELVEQFQKKI